MSTILSRSLPRTHVHPQDVPGFNVTTQTDDANVLHIRVFKKKESTSDSDESGWHFHRKERTEAQGYRSIPLPSTVDLTGITSSVLEGTLTVRCPKLVQQMPTRRNIPVISG